MARHVCEFIEFIEFKEIDGETEIVFCDIRAKHTDAYIEKCGDPANQSVSFGCVHRDGTGEDRKTCDCPAEFWLCDKHYEDYKVWMEENEN